MQHLKMGGVEPKIREISYDREKKPLRYKNAEVASSARNVNTILTLEDITLISDTTLAVTGISNNQSTINIGMEASVPISAGLAVRITGC